MKIRMFIAFKLPGLVRSELHGYAKSLSGQDKQKSIRWLESTNYHMTLVFLGNVEYSKLSNLKYYLENKLFSMPAIPFKITSICQYPFSRPKIIASFLEFSPQILELQHNVEKIVRKQKIEFKNKRFLPHITLGRFKKRGPFFYNPKFSSIFLEGIFDKVSIFQSELNRDGAIHTILDDISLRTFSII